MKRFAVDWRPVTAIGVVLLVMGGLVVVWSLQGRGMRDHFIKALRRTCSGGWSNSMPSRKGKWSDRHVPDTLYRSADELNRKSIAACGFQH
jgi:hypothetical protein